MICVDAFCPKRPKGLSAIMLHVRLTTLVKVLFLFMAALHLIWAELSMAMAMAMNGCQRPDKPQYPAIKEMESPGIQLRSKVKVPVKHSRSTSPFILHA